MNIVKGANDTVKVRWYCGHYSGAPKWHSGIPDWSYEPDECQTEFDTTEDIGEWKEELCSAICPSCGAQLTQLYDDPQLIKENTNGKA